MRILIAALLLSLSTNAGAQLPDQEYRGAAALGLALRDLGTTKRVLMIGAHPDDEDGQLISVLSLRDGAAVAYLSLTRGEGGQNSIGDELGPALGILRTGELLAARKADRARQFFTRAYDFGFSKTAEETLQHWPRDSVLADVVATVRRYRPDIIVAVFSGTPSDGHGHHQVSGMLARDAFTAAADPGRFPQQLKAGLRPHRTLKLFQTANFRGTPTHRLQIGVLDPLPGRSYAQVAALSRSRHRSQDFGAAQTPGPRSTAVALQQSLVGTTGDSSLFAGIDTTLSAKAVGLHENAAVVRTLQRYDSLIADAKARLSPFDLNDAVTPLAAALGALDDAAGAARDADLRFAITNEQELAADALLQAAEVVIDATTDAAYVIPGESFQLNVSVWNAGKLPARLGDLSPSLPDGWRAQRTDSSTAVIGAGAIVVRRYLVHVPYGAALSQPYFLRHARPADYYDWTGEQENAGRPFEPAVVRVDVSLEVAGRTVHVSRSATRRQVDPRQGELRSTVLIAPAFVLEPHPAVAVLARSNLEASANRAVEAKVEVTSNGSGGRVVVEPHLPAGWSSAPQRTNVQLAGPGESKSVTFAITPPRTVPPGSYSVDFTATDSAGRRYDLRMRVIDYAHIDKRLLFEAADFQVRVLDVRFARGLRVGYVVGMDAQVPPVLEQLGIGVDALDEKALATADLSKYDAIVIGSRAYQVRPDLVAYNARVLDYGRRGGNVVALYQQYEFIQGDFAPFPLTIARPHDRITDENAPVRILEPGARALTRPNAIGPADFEGWVQERALYMPHTWASEYTPLLEMADPNEAPKQGAIVTAPLGSGVYTYTAIPFFREIPAGVPGALRLFVNLLSLGLKEANL